MFRIKAFYFVLGIIITISVGTSQCTKEKALEPYPAYTCDTTTYNFDDDIRPMLINYCRGSGVGSGCHDTWLYNYNTMINYLDVIRLRTLDYRDMPVPGNQFSIPALTYEQLNMLHCWIEQGYPQN